MDAITTVKVCEGRYEFIFDDLGMCIGVKNQDGSVTPSDMLTNAGIMAAKELGEEREKRAALVEAKTQT